MLTDQQWDTYARDGFLDLGRVLSDDEVAHQLGLLSRYGSTVADHDVATHCTPDRVQPLPVAAGHAVLVHNWLHTAPA